MTMGLELVNDEKTGKPLSNAKPATRLALTGRVPVKVTNENGAITPGDTSDKIINSRVRYEMDSA